MSILQEIQKWSVDQPAWQQDAIARIYSQAELSTQDLDDLYALLKVEHGIPDPAGRTPDKLAADQIAGAAPKGERVQLESIKNLRNVNALAPEQRIPIAKTGLSVIYGENGAGKSGYSRVLKKACRARDQSEPIHPDARLAPGQVSVPQASFDILIDDQPVEVTWVANQAAPEPLSAIAIFDSHCARAYVDNKGDFAYVPYGLDILERLVGVCGKLKTMAATEVGALRPKLDAFAALGQTPTKTGALLRGLSAKTKPAEVEALASLTDADKERLAVLTRALAERDPKQKAQELKAKSIRHTELAQRVAASAAHLTEVKLAILRDLIGNSVAAKKAADLASKAFKETPGLLAGTGGELWKTLFEAARQFAAESHPGKKFPHLGAESECPLCQNRLEKEGADRLEQFDKFVQQEAEKREKAARDAAVAAYNELRGAQINLLLEGGLTAELEAGDPDLLAQCQDYQRSLTLRHAAAVKACTPGENWNAIPALTENPQARLSDIAVKLTGEAKALEDSADDKAKALMVAEHAELDARTRLFDLKAAALDVIEKLILVGQLETCMSKAGATTGISKQSTLLSNSIATQEVVAALNDELKALNVHELKAAMKAETSRGKTQYKLVLEMPGNMAAKDILSEGEQRAIAIAAFLAEVNLGGGLGGVVFDDPVSSLDHRRRWHVAKRLAKEALKRQVIVFTHDIYFLCILQQCAAELELDLNPQCIRKAPGGFGVQSDRIPFDAMPTTKRVGALREMRAKVAAAKNSGDEEKQVRLTRDAYYNLRLAWERAVEEVLLFGTVTRFEEGISTLRLRSVIVEDGDYSAIEAGMTKCSKFAHDPALGAHLPTPTPEELADDIETLNTWRAAVENRREEIRKRRQ
jgi:hypothetical protein